MTDLNAIRVKVKPGSREPGLEQRPDGSWIARVKSPPVDGKANREMIELFADHFGVAKSQVEIRSGAGGRMKLLRILGG